MIWHYTPWNAYYLRLYGWRCISPCLESRNHKRTLKENSVLHVLYYNPWAGMHTGTQTCRKASVNGGLHSPTRAGYLSQRTNSGTERTGIYGEWAWVCKGWKIFWRKMSLNQMLGLTRVTEIIYKKKKSGKWILDQMKIISRNRYYLLPVNGRSKRILGKRLRITSPPPPLPEQYVTVQRLTWLIGKCHFCGLMGHHGLLIWLILMLYVESA